MNRLCWLNRHETGERFAGYTPASVGLAIVPQDGIQFEEVRKKADFAMIKSKQNGKNTWSLYNSDLHKDILRKSSIVSGLREALEKNSLELYFQPKVDLVTGMPIGAEALLRWARNNPYNIRPDEFIPVIESSSLMIDIGNWVIEEACAACKEWHLAGFADMHVAINVSVRQLSRNDLRPVLQHALASADLEARFLEIELTEHLLLSNTKEVVRQLEQIKAIGVTLAIDDFGTGYSNLSYLSKFKVDLLKLDQTFIHNLNLYKESLDIVTAVIAMAKILGLKTIAEGIETDEQWSKLHKLGCDYGQGYLWEKPLSAPDFQKYLREVSKQNSPGDMVLV